MKSIKKAVENFIRGGEGDFNAIACELFRRQCHLNPVYGNYAGTVRDAIKDVARWEEIPALPIAAYKMAAVTTFPVAEAAVVFRSSGTTSTDRGSHYFKDTGLYELSILQGWPSHPSGQVRILAFSQEPSSVPDSSLIHMFRTLIVHFGDSQSRFIQEHGPLVESLGHAEEEGCPVWLLGTALALHGFLDYCDAKLASFAFESHLLVMETGGFKGRTESIPPPLFYRRLCATLGISMFSVLSEYGMCELSSQFYTRPGSEKRVFLPPPWVRWRIVHPLTGEPMTGGERGVLEIFDLANVDSALAIRSEDTAHTVDDGLVLDGRIATAPTKGCSLMA
mgnify:CR=1 FL=1